MNSGQSRLIILFVLLVLLLSACNMPARGTPTASGAGLVYTAAAQTVQAQLTQIGQPPGTAVGFPTSPPATPQLPSLTPTPIPPSPTPLPTATPLPCDQAAFVKDVTYPDNSEVAAGETFVKTWRLQNAGTCTWTTAYAVVFAGGERMGAPAAQPLPGSVAPGETVDVSVSLTAPVDGGTYRAEFKLRNASNVIFGVGSQHGPFWVQIKVPVATGLLYDFLIRADDATWSSGVGSDFNTNLTFNGADDDVNGVAKIKDQVKLENKATSGKVLLMFPKHENNGSILGLFPAYKVQKGDHFKARLGFMLPSGEACGAGKVRFQVAYKEEGSNLKLLGEWVKSCNGSLLPVDLDLSALGGKTVQFGFVVLAEGAFTDDWAIWNSPRIEH